MLRPGSSAETQCKGRFVAEVLIESIRVWDIAGDPSGNTGPQDDSLSKRPTQQVT